MNWKENLDKALHSLKELTDNETVRDLTEVTREMARDLANKVRGGAMNAAEVFGLAEAEPTSLKLKYFNANISVVSPSTSITITSPHTGSVVIDDGHGNGLIINAMADQAYVVESIGAVKQLNDNTYDLGVEDGINVVVIKS